MLRRGCLVPTDVATGDRVAELIRERSPAPSDSRPDGSRRDVEYRGDLGVVEAYEIAQRDRSSVVGRQTAERGIDVELTGDGVVERGTPILRLRQRFHRRRSPGPAARFVERGIGSDAIAPSRELGPAVERFDPAGNREQGFLCGVERVVGICEDSPAHCMHQARVPVQERVEGGAVTAGGRGGELVVAVVGLHRGQR